MKKYALTLNLKDDPKLIQEYIQYHQEVWGEIQDSIKESGIVSMDIYIQGTRLFMLMEVDESFSFEKKAAMDQNNPKVQEWENLMWKYQAPVDGAQPDEKWVLMQNIYHYNQ